MANSFQESLKSEIGRVARQQLKQELESLRGSSKKHRAEIAALKRDVAALVSELRKLKKTASVTGVGVNDAHKDSDLSEVIRPVTGEQLLRKREALQLTQREAGLLIGVSFQSIHKWEGGNVHPRARQLPQIHQFLKLGKRAAKQRLEELTNAES